MDTPQTVKNQYDVVLSHYKNHIKDEQLAIFYVVCTQITKAAAVDLLKKFRQEPAVVLKTYDSLAQAQSFAEALIAVGAHVNIHSHSHDPQAPTACVLAAPTKRANHYLFNYRVMRFQLSVGLAVLFISFVTQSALLAVFSLFFIIFMLIELKSARPYL